jgi:hypothetical protein
MLTFEQFCREIDFESNFLTDSYGCEINYTAFDVRNSSNYNRSVNLKQDWGMVLWRYSLGSFNGYGPTLLEAKEDLEKITSKLPDNLKNDIYSIQTFLA